MTQRLPSTKSSSATSFWVSASISAAASHHRPRAALSLPARSDHAGPVSGRYRSGRALVLPNMVGFPMPGGSGRGPSGRVDFSDSSRASTRRTRAWALAFGRKRARGARRRLLDGSRGCRPDQRPASGEDEDAANIRRWHLLSRWHGSSYRIRAGTSQPSAASCFPCRRADMNVRVATKIEPAGRSRGS